ncbi:hypothetical protein ADK34_17935 [Streptomyces viridochromogenes]|uniref:Uncharacterized protein n=1 Tax=Streptomyces viridochromogenes TaxID=1938 RepID=A0A0L8KH03_STRVR|nr:hypothetical protein ADK34_17935 [Streptomyces viridochromogenes]
MSGGTESSGGAAAPSRWARECFGKQASGLVAGIPKRLARAHQRARIAHDQADLKKRGPYGHVLAEAVLEELADEARALGGSVRELRGYDFAVLNGWALFPFKYADRPVPLDRARLRADVSAQRKRLLTAHGPEPREGLFPLEEVSTTPEYDKIHEVFEELGRSTKLVSVFFTASRGEGIHSIHWGEAHLEDDRTFTWSPVEPLPLYTAKGR